MSRAAPLRHRLGLGVLLADDAALPAAVELIRCRPPAEAEAALFLMDDGVRAVDDPAVLALFQSGVDVVACAADARARSIELRPGGPRAGSQYDHALMMRDAEHVVAMTGAGVDEHRPTGQNGRAVGVRLTRDPRHPKTAQALRAAVGYAGSGLRVTVVAEGAAAGLLASEDQPPPVARALATLRGLGHPIVPAAAAPAFDVEVTW